jgi:hypothetical protein
MGIRTRIVAVLIPVIALAMVPVLVSFSSSPYFDLLFQSYQEDEHYSDGKLKSRIYKKLHRLTPNVGMGALLYSKYWWPNGRTRSGGFVSGGGKTTWWAENGQVVDRWKYSRPGGFGHDDRALSFSPQIYEATWTNGPIDLPPVRNAEVVNSYRSDLAPVDGKRVCYYPDGRLKIEIHYKESRVDGPFKVWGPDGKLLTDENFYNGNPVGVFRVTHPDGGLAFEGEFRQGSPVGTHRYWTPSGKLRNQVVYTISGGGSEQGAGDKAPASR